MTHRIVCLSILHVVCVGCATRPQFNPVAPGPLVHCFAIAPDSGHPSFMVSKILLGTKPLFDTWRAGTVRPERHSSGRKMEVRWRSMEGDSTLIEWWLPATAFGPVGILIAKLTSDSLSGRATAGSDVIPLGPWILVHGHREPCASGA